MTVGESLAAARSRAGLSVDELSERTRIRETVIRCIEQDDYDSCGGDLFVRGYVRALAGAVGIDAQPLIREYDKTHAESPDATDTTGGTPFAHVARVADPVPPVDPAATSADLPVAAADAAATAADPQLPPGRPADRVADPDVTAADLPVVPEDPMPTVADLPVIPAGSEPMPPPPRPQPGRQRQAKDQGRRRRRAARVAILAVLVLAVAGVASGLVVSSQPAPSGKNAAAVTQHSAAAHTSRPPASASPAPTASTPAPSPSAKPLAAITSLPIAQAEAFGPGGLADGDNPQTASGAVTSGASSPWVSQWYATAVFGSLKQGTGLLIDMGRQVTVTSVRIDLAGYRGANLQLRTGDTAGTPSDLRIAARAYDVGGTVRITLQAPERARYVLIWFTLLPPNGAGQYQATVYHVVVDGRR